MRENLSSGFANNTGADQPAQSDQRLCNVRPAKPQISLRIRPSLHLSKCQIVGNLMQRLNCNYLVLFSLQTESNVSVPQFCFPDAANFKPSSSNMKRFVYT